MDFLRIINHMNKMGICFTSGLTDNTIAEIEEVYEIRFPDSLKVFYKTMLPISTKCEEPPRFPRWNDLSPKNINFIRQLMDAPYQWLRRDIEKGFWLPIWEGKTIDELFENTPKLIPIFAHRYMPVVEGLDDLPIISTVGRDTVYYGHNLSEYLEVEFSGKRLNTNNFAYIPFWSEIIEKNR